MDLKKLTRRKAGSRPASDSVAEQTRLQVANAAEMASGGRFIDAIRLLESLINDLATRGRRDCLAEPLVARSQILDEALVRDRDRQLSEYAAYKNLPPRVSVRADSFYSEVRSSPDTQAIALHSAAGYMNAIPIYKEAGEKQSQTAAEKALEIALVRACARQPCKDERMLVREFRKMFKQMGLQQLGRGESSLQFADNAAITAWSIASQLEEQATRNWRRPPEEPPPDRSW